MDYCKVGKLVRVKDNLSKYTGQHLKINGSYFELSIQSILPIAWCNINVLGLLGTAFISFLVEIETIYTCSNSTDIDCYNTTGYHYPNYIIPTLIEDCSLYTDTDQVICYKVQYRVFTALGIVGGFLLTVPRVAFGIFTLIHNTLIMLLNSQTLSQYTCVHNSIKFIYYISFFLFVILNLSIMSFIMICTGEYELIQTKALRINTKEQIAFAVLIISMFLSCPFQLRHQYLRIKEKSRYLTLTYSILNSKKIYHYYTLVHNQ